MGKAGLAILLAFLFLLSVGTDWIQFRDELEDMREDNELSGQQDKEET